MYGTISRRPTTHPQTQEPLQPLVCQRSCCCHSWLFTSSWLIVTSLHRHQRPPLIVAAAFIVAIASLCDYSHPSRLTEKSVQKKKEAEKVYLYLCQCLQPTKTYFAFFWISLYVGFVPVSNVLDIFVSDRRCEFW
jgi:hypothetical protein